jgi:hypothetical protein
MELRPWLLWVVAAAGILVLLAADACGQKIFTNTWAVHIPGGLAVADSVARKHGFHNLGQVGVLTWPAGLGTGYCPGLGWEGWGHWQQRAGTYRLVFQGIWGVGRFWVASGMGPVACPARGLLT